MFVMKRFTLLLVLAGCSTSNLQPYDDGLALDAKGEVIEGEFIIFLDTTTGVVSQKQLNWLKEQLAAHQEELIIFMHHPPLIGGVPFMDSKHYLRNMDEVQAVLTAHPYNLTIFTGHYHVEKTIRYKNLEVNITPSCFFQIDQQSREFKVDHYRVGFRKIEVENKMLRHSVCYL